MDDSSMPDGRSRGGGIFAPSGVDRSPGNSVLELGGEPLSRGSISILAAACGLAVANANYAQPLLVSMGQAFHLSDAVVGLIPALTQFGVAAGILLLLPLGDTVPVRRLLTVAVVVQSLALAAIALAPDGTALLGLSLAVGFFGITPYLLPPYATLRTPPERRGHVTALLAQGVIVGMLLARSVSGFIGLHFGWRSVYALASVAMLLLIVPLRRTVQPARAVRLASYPALMGSLVHVFRRVPVVRWSALCQAFATGSFTVLWVGISFYMQSRAFGWHSDGVGALALIGAAAAVCAPYVGGFADRQGPRRSLLVALAVVVVSWALLAVSGHRVAGVIAGMILLDVGAAAADISNRTVIFGLPADIRTRLAAIYMVGKFSGAGMMAWLTGVVWSIGGWTAVCALGAASATLAALTAWIGVGRVAGEAACRGTGRPLQPPLAKPISARSECRQGSGVASL
jgi:predicted MFS family arabinose efflux permease